MSRVRVLVERECEHRNVGLVHRERCTRDSIEPLTEFPPEAVEAAKRAALAVEWMGGEFLTDYNNRKVEAALAAALEAITKEDEK